MSYLDVDFFARETLEVARDLIGTILVVGKCEARIVETEAYTTDAASHAVTRRHQSVWMQETHGHIYVFFIYGMYYCLNFTTEPEGFGAVLIRAAEPLQGLGIMARRRGTKDPKSSAPAQAGLPGAGHRPKAERPAPRPRIEAPPEDRKASRHHQPADWHFAGPGAGMAVLRAGQSVREPGLSRGRVEISPVICDDTPSAVSKRRVSRQRRKIHGLTPGAHRQG